MVFSMNLNFGEVRIELPKQKRALVQISVLCQFFIQIYYFEIFKIKFYKDVYISKRKIIFLQFNTTTDIIKILKIIV